MFSMEKLPLVSRKKHSGENGSDVVSSCIGERPIVSDSNWAEEDDAPIEALALDSVGVLGGDFRNGSSFGSIDYVCYGPQTDRTETQTVTERLKCARVLR